MTTADERITRAELEELRSEFTEFKTNMQQLFEDVAKHVSQTQSPVRYEGDSVFFRKDAMKEGLPYHFTHDGKKGFVILNGDDLAIYGYE